MFPDTWRVPSSPGPSGSVIPVCENLGHLLVVRICPAVRLAHRRDETFREGGVSTHPGLLREKDADHEPRSDVVVAISPRSLGAGTASFFPFMSAPECTGRAFGAIITVTGAAESYIAAGASMTA